MSSPFNLYMCKASGSTTYLYPKDDINAALKSTTFKYAFDGTNMVFSDEANLLGVYNDIYQKTVISQPDGNPGYSCHDGTLLEDMGENIHFKYQNGLTIVSWRLVRQITPQSILPTPGNSPNGTIGFVTTFCSYGLTAWSATSNILDVPSVIRVN